MRILLLTILFIGTFYFFNQDEKTSSAEIDSVKLKMGAPDRAGRILTVEKPVLMEEAVSESPKVSDTLAEPEEESRPQINSSEESEDLEHVEEIQLTDLEAGWNNELKEFLTRLEPVDGDSIHSAYLQEQESYQAELEALMNEKQQKSSEDTENDIEEVISQLDQKHQERLKEILGGHFEAVHDHYSYYMETASAEQ